MYTMQHFPSPWLPYLVLHFYKMTIDSNFLSSWICLVSNDCDFVFTLNVGTFTLVCLFVFCFLWWMSLLFIILIFFVVCFPLFIFRSVACAQCWLCLWIVHSWFPLQFSLTVVVALPVVNASALTWFIRDMCYCNLHFLNNTIIIKTKVLLPQV